MSREVYVSQRNGYVFNNESKKLEFFNYEKAQFSFESGEVLYFGKLGGEDSVLKDIVLYESEEHFKRGVHITDKRTIREVEIQRRGLRYVWRDGRPIEMPKDMEYIIGKCWNVELASGERTYDSIEEAYDFNDFIVKEDDGTERIVKCAASKVDLTDEQRLFIKQFNDLVKGMEQYGLGFMYDQCEGVVKVINKQKIERLDCDCERYTDEGWADVKRMYQPTELACSYTHDDDYINAKFKD